MIKYGVLRIEASNSEYSEVKVSVWEEDPDKDLSQITMDFKFPYNADQTLGQLKEAALALAKLNMPQIYHPSA